MAKKKTKSKKHKIKRAQICPHCGSPDIETDFSNAAAVAFGYLSIIKCNNCKHEGTFFPTVPISKIKKPIKPSQVKTNTKKDITFAKGYFGTFMLSIAILFIFGGTYALILKSRIGIIFIITGLIALLILKLRKDILRN